MMMMRTFVKNVVKHLKRSEVMNKRTVSILGCGWLGLPLGARLVECGFRVKGSTRTKNKHHELKTLGIEPFCIDISKRVNRLQLFLTSDILIISMNTKSIDDYLYLISEIKQSQIKKVIFISSTSVYKAENTEVTEEMPVLNSYLTEQESLFRTENQFLATILRFGGLFGDERKPGNFIKPNTRIKHPEGVINYIHREDCIDVLLRILKTNLWNETLNACADVHPIRRNFFIHEMKKLNKPTPLFDEETPSIFKRVSNRKCKQLLGATFSTSNAYLSESLE